MKRKGGIMISHKLPPLKSPVNHWEHKATSHSNQLQTIFHYLHEHIATVGMVAAATGIPKTSICRYKRDLEKAGKLWEIEKKRCQKTGYKAWYLTTNSKQAIRQSCSQILNAL